MNSNSKFGAASVLIAVLSLCPVRPRADAPPPPTITRLAIRNAQLSFRWDGPSGLGAHVVETRESIASTSWQPVPGIPWPSTTLEFIDPRPAADVGRFYRLTIPEPAANRGQLLSATFVRRLIRSEIQLLLGLAGVAVPVNHDVKFYRLEYETVGPAGETTTASGGVAVPEGIATPLPLVSYQHGTELERSNVPSNLNTEALVALALAADGYLGVAPDYLGLGSSAFPYHPYHHAKTEATATVDMIRAARVFAFNTNLVLSGSVFLAGYSQGGHATLAAHREIERYHQAEFKIVACAPGAGAYDLSGSTADDTLSGRPQPNPYYFAYLLASYQRLYQFAESLSALFKAPYASDLPPLFDGNHTSDDVNAKMPSVPTTTLQPEVLAAFASDPDHPFRRALRDNDLLDWAPKAPIRLFHCEGDGDVIFKNAEVALARLKANGAASVELRHGGNLNHVGCAPFALLGAKEWFDSLR